MPEHIIVSENANRKTRLVCPVCGFDYVHPIGITCAPTENTGGTLKVIGDVISWNGHADVVTLKFFCEDGHHFEYQLQFHKGATLLTVSATNSDDQVR